jgi:hypothetical protein
MRCTSSGQAAETGVGIYKRAVTKLVCETEWTVCGLPVAISLLFWLNWAAGALLRADLAKAVWKLETSGFQTVTEGIPQRWQFVLLSLPRKGGLGSNGGSSWTEAGL